MVSRNHRLLHLAHRYHHCHRNLLLLGDHRHHHHRLRARLLPLPRSLLLQVVVLVQQQKRQRQRILTLCHRHLQCLACRASRPFCRPHHLLDRVQLQIQTLPLLPHLCLPLHQHPLLLPYHRLCLRLLNRHRATVLPILPATAGSIRTSWYLLTEQTQPWHTAQVSSDSYHRMPRRYTTSTSRRRTAGKRAVCSSHSHPSRTSTRATTLSRSRRPRGTAPPTSYSWRAQPLHLTHSTPCPASHQT